MITSAIRQNKQKDEINEEQALFDHYRKCNIKNKTEDLKLTDAYEVTFFEKPPKDKLDIAENFWITKLKSKINVIKSNFPQCN